MKTASEVSKFFLKLSQPEIGDIITNLKLQKLLYYAQGFNLAINETPLFDEQIIAWEHGPVVESVYQEYKSFGSNALPQPDDFNPNDIFLENEIDLILEVNQVFGQFSAWKLRNMTHSESPWLSTIRNNEITHEKLKEYFKTQVV